MVQALSFWSLDLEPDAGAKVLLSCASCLGTRGASGLRASCEVSVSSNQVSALHQEAADGEVEGQGCRLM